MSERDWRVRDFAELLKEGPPEPIPWRVDRFVADGTLTLLCGRAGSFKTWVGLGMAVAVTRGEPFAGIPTEQGSAALVDFEMGPRMYKRRGHRVKLDGSGIRYINAAGLNLAHGPDLEWIAEQLDDINYVFIDSLKRGTPTLTENDNDEQAAVVAALGTVARNLDTAVTLSHHQGRDPNKWFRGATAMQDQTDALFGLLPVGDDDDDSPLRRLSCRSQWGKMRDDEDPEDRFMQLDVDRGGMVEAKNPSHPRQTQYEDAIKEALPFTGTKDGLAKKCETHANNNAWRAAFDALPIVKAEGAFHLMPDINVTASADETPFQPNPNNDT